MERIHGSDMTRAIDLACRFIQSNLDMTPTLAEIGAHVGVSPFHLQRVFKRETGISPRQYGDAQRLKRFKKNLRECATVTNALYDAGYGSSSRVYENTHQLLGMTPATYRKYGEGMVIGYGLFDSPLGRLLVARTERGLCALHLASSAGCETDEDLIACLYKEYPLATIEAGRFEFTEWVEAIFAHFDGQRPNPDLPLDVQATAFQWRVWQELLRIPYGQTRTYKEITTALGLPPEAASAVAKACHDNPVAVIIPCHRTQREDGEASTFYKGRTLESWEKARDNEQHNSQP